MISHIYVLNALKVFIAANSVAWGDWIKSHPEVDLDKDVMDWAEESTAVADSLYAHDGRYAGSQFGDVFGGWLGEFLLREKRKPTWSEVLYQVRRMTAVDAVPDSDVGIARAPVKLKVTHGPLTAQYITKGALGNPRFKMAVHQYGYEWRRGGELDFISLLGDLAAEMDLAWELAEDKGDEPFCYAAAEPFGYAAVEKVLELDSDDDLYDVLSEMAKETVAGYFSGTHTIPIARRFKRFSMKSQGVFKVCLSGGSPYEGVLDTYNLGVSVSLAQLLSTLSQWYSYDAAERPSIEGLLQTHFINLTKGIQHVKP